MKLAELNFFQNRSRDPQIIHQQILTTRLFILLFSIGLLILIAYTSLSERTRTETIQRPSLTTYKKLASRYSNTLRCPCQQISILPRRFVTTTSKFHQVCSSHFVSQSWIDFTFGVDTRYIFPMDIRNFLSAMWQLISALCQSAINATDDALAKFGNDPLITSQLSTESLLEAQIRSRLDDAQQLAKVQYVKDLETMETISKINGFMTGLLTNFAILSVFMPGYEIYPVTVIMAEQFFPRASQDGYCSCYRSVSCRAPTGLYLMNRNEYTGFNDQKLVANTTVPGIFFDCVPILATFASSLECFFNRSCIDLLQQIYGKSIKVTTLNKTYSSRFPMNMSLKQIIGELFLEEIVNGTSYSAYYNECAPSLCTYTFSQRFDRIFIIATLLGLVGGLNAALRLVSPYLIKLVLLIKHKCSHRRNKVATFDIGELTNHSDHPGERIGQSIWRKIKLMIVEFDTFSDDPHYRLDDHQSRLASRMYVLLMTLHLLVLVIYINQSNQKVTTTLISPTEKQYEYLLELHGNNLQCPCSSVTIPYHYFVQIKPTYHQLCSSDFIQPNWYLSLSYTVMYTLVVDFQPLSSSYFQALSFFCSFANDTFNHAYHQFLSMAYVHPQPLSLSAFTIQTDALIQTFLNTTRAAFLNEISSINALLHIDQYVTGVETNTFYRLNYIDDESTPSPYRAYPTFKIYNNQTENMCHCGKKEDCTMIELDPSDNFYPEGFSFRCSILDIVLHSSLACWFDYNCSNQLISTLSQIGSYVLTNITIMNSNLPTRFPPNDTFETIMNELLVEYYNISVNYGHYYDNCQPLSCTYTYEEKSSLIYIVTTVIGLFGGLNVVIRLISPLLVQLYLNQRRKKTRIAVIIERHGDAHLMNTPPPSRCQKWYHRLEQLNFFATGSTNISTIQRERLSTRFYLFFLSVSITIVIMYTIVPTNATNKSIDSPSLMDYQKLLLTNDDSSLNCPCSQISIPHAELVSIDVTYHQICSSDFVNSLWISNGDFSLLRVRDDFRVIVGVYFRMLSTLCVRAKTAVDNVIKEFLMKHFLSSSVISPTQFSSRMNDLTMQLERSASSGFSRMIQLLRDYLHGNAFVSSYDLNWYYWSIILPESNYLWSAPITFNDSCSCGKRSDCTSSRPFSPWLPGLVMGCSITEGVMRSSLISLYNQTLLENLSFAFISNSSRIFYPKILNASSPSRYQTNTLVHDLTHQLFIEQWSFNTTYESFYDRCNPRSCYFIREERNNALFLTSRLLGLYGGITISCRVIVPYITRLWLWKPTCLSCHHS